MRWNKSRKKAPLHIKAHTHTHTHTHTHARTHAHAHTHTHAHAWTHIPRERDVYRQIQFESSKKATIAYRTIRQHYRAMRWQSVRSLSVTPPHHPQSWSPTSWTNQRERVWPVCKTCAASLRPRFSFDGSAHGYDKARSWFPSPIQPCSAWCRPEHRAFSSAFRRIFWWLLWLWARAVWTPRHGCTCEGGWCTHESPLLSTQSVLSCRPFEASSRSPGHVLREDECIAHAQIKPGEDVHMHQMLIDGLQLFMATVLKYCIFTCTMLYRWAAYRLFNTTQMATMHYNYVLIDNNLRVNFLSYHFSTSVMSLPWVQPVPHQLLQQPLLLQPLSHQPSARLLLQWDHPRLHQRPHPEWLHPPEVHRALSEWQSVHWDWRCRHGEQLDQRCAPSGQLFHCVPVEKTVVTCYSS